MYWPSSRQTLTIAATPSQGHDPKSSPAMRLLRTLHRRSYSADTDAAHQSPAAPSPVFTRLRSDSSASSRSSTSGGSTPDDARDIELHTFGPYHRENPPASSTQQAESPVTTVEGASSDRRPSNASSTYSWESRGVTFSEQRRRSQQVWKGCW